MALTWAHEVLIVFGDFMQICMTILRGAQWLTDVFDKDPVTYLNSCGQCPSQGGRAEHK